VTEAVTKYNPWFAYVVAREEARRTGSRRVGTEHLFLALLRESDIAELVAVTIEQARDVLDSLDRSALDVLGIHPTRNAGPIPMRAIPPRLTVNVVLRDRLPMTPAAKAVLERAWEPRRRGKQFRTVDVLRELIELKPPDPVGELLTALAIDRRVICSRIEHCDSR
jgi:Clp amino terminal domain, pathogenicity island component